MGLFGDSTLDRKINTSMSKIQGMRLAPAMAGAYGMSQSLANQGMDAASRQLAMQESSRATNSLARQARDKKSFLAMAPGLYKSSNDFALRLAADDAMIRRQNTLSGIETGMQFGQAQTELEKYRNEAQYNELSATKARRAQTMTGILNAAGSIGGAMLGNPSGLKGIFGKK